MPLVLGPPDGAESLLDDRNMDGVETTTAPTSKKNFPRDSVLYKKIIWVKFHENRIIKGKFTR
jgi:hypothetical protein